MLRLFIAVLMFEAVLAPAPTSAGVPDVCATMKVGAGSLVELAPPRVRRDFEAGIAALHDFWWGEAERRFRSVQRESPAFALGYWGEAMSLHHDPFGHREPPVDSMRAILGHFAPTRAARARRTNTRLECLYLDALETLIEDRGAPATRHPAYVLAMEELAAEYPDDVEALAFLARAQLLRERSFLGSPGLRAAVAETSRRVLTAEPDHPGGLHYLIHALDTPETAADALDAADRYVAIARGASHALHMPSHIYLQLGRWNAAVSSNRAAVEASRARPTRGEAAESRVDLHALDFLVYALLQQGREDETREILAEMRRLAETHDRVSLRRMNALLHARYAMEAGVRSDVPLPRSGDAAPAELLALGVYAVQTKDVERIRSLLEEMRNGAGSHPSVGWQISLLELQAALAMAGDLPEEAIPLLHEAIGLQSDLPRPSETPSPEKPPEELLGELLLALDRPADAERAFHAGATRWPARLATRLGLARAAAARGRADEASRRYQMILDQLDQAADRHPAAIEARRALIESSAECGGEL